MCSINSSQPCVSWESERASDAMGTWLLVAGWLAPTTKLFNPVSTGRIDVNQIVPFLLAPSLVTSIKRTTPYYAILPGRNGE